MQYRSSERAEGHGVPYLCILKITLSPDALLSDNVVGFDVYHYLYIVTPPTYDCSN